MTEAARCEMCHRERLMPGGCWRDFATYDDGENDVCSRLGFERLKAENASLLESLREARQERDEERRSADGAAGEMANWRAMADRNTKALAVAEQRAEAAEKERDIESVERNRQWDKRKVAEKRAADMMGHLREIVPAATRDWHRQLPKLGDPEPDVGGLPEALATSRLGAALTAARAALHDEERRPQEESYGGIDRSSAGRFEVPEGLTVGEGLELVLRDAALSPDGNMYITLTDTEYRAARAVLVGPHMSGATEKHARGHSAECGGQPAGSGCICGVGFAGPPAGSDSSDRAAAQGEEK